MPGEFCGQKSLAGSSPGGVTKELDRTEKLTLSLLGSASGSIHSRNEGRMVGTHSCCEVGPGKAESECLACALAWVYVGPQQGHECWRKIVLSTGRARLPAVARCTGKTLNA